MSVPESGPSRPRLEELFGLAAPSVDYDLLARYAEDKEGCTPEERDEVEQQIALNPDLAVAVGVADPPSPRPASSPPAKSRWAEFVLSALVVVLSAVLHRLASEVSVPDSLAWLDARAAFELRLREWGWLIGGMLVCVGAVLAALGRLLRWRVILPLGLVVFAGFVLASVQQAAGEIRATRARLDQLFLSHQWVAYESPKLDPKQGKFPSEADIRAELDVLHKQGGFDALITFGSDGTLAAAPRIAKTECGFRAVVQGIYIPEVQDAAGNPADPDGALRRQLDHLLEETPDGVPDDYVDAYCVGHNVSNRVPIQALAGWMAEVRRRTRKPVTTTAPLHFYLGPQSQRFRQLGDFYFPDVNGGWSTVIGATPDQALSQLRQDLYRVGELTDKPVLLKMISYPSGGRGLMPDHQLEFFRGVSTFVRPPRGCYLSVFSGFDLPWKKPPEFDPTEEHAGLFSADLKPKPAVGVLRNGFLVQNRP
jgi:hypothetical protein